MAKKIIYTVLLGFFVVFGIYFLVELIPNYICDIKLISEGGPQNALLSDDWLWYMIKQALKILFIIISIIFAVIKGLKYWIKKYN